MNILQIVRSTQLVLSILAFLLLATKFISYRALYKGGSEGILPPLKFISNYSAAEMDASNSRSQKRFMRFGNIINKAFWVLLLLLIFVTLLPQIISLN